MLDLSRFPRVALIDAPTPIQPLDGLSRHFGDALNGVRLFVKRDDLGPVGGGGNKLRKLEFLLGQARADGADTVITVGALQSNHARLTAAAAARCGFRCELFLTRSVPRDDADYTGNGNRLLHALFGARVHLLPGDADSLAAAKARAGELESEGRRVAVFPSGGSSPLGCLGYAACAAEILDQSAAMGLDFAQVVTANGSSGTHAGLVAGFAALGHDPRLAKSYTVLAPLEDARRITFEKAEATADLLGVSIPEDAIVIDGDHRRDGYGIPTEGMLEAVRLMATTEGLLLDPVYSGKAFAGLLADVRAGAYRPGDAVLFLMTGGVPGLFAYRGVFASA
ncbi:D-cysteine desulfhydrase family protein [Methylobacterium haplocladii]|uniref:D-cysteine desulfhydrase n=1 Tax=Methylobacterium haplocladii TaxID=1176176 RepID=A0A512IR96_9HYPH|nr:D-cysteine desulfhydrase family protein [Methylobacterium haplocladii]GEP00139.1 D-cysteine desulfhydrase [Methylobacterium haplocladii]GJD82169.1 L-cysteate sulfo-lyase [Methylobacterium haplocladii]GLS58187.1 D-cysteine desulfhydrase [Methylobacterium haplocladii]